MSERQFDIELHFPAPDSERRAHGIDPDVCAMIFANTGGGDTESLAIATAKLLPTRQHVVALVRGSFDDKTLAALMSGSIASEKYGFFFLKDRADVRRLFELSAESVVVFSCTDPALRAALLIVESLTVPFWRFQSRSVVGMLAAMSREVGPLFMFSRDDASVEVFGTEEVILSAFAALQTLTGRQHA